MESQVEANFITTPGEASCQEQDRHGRPLREFRRAVKAGLIEAVPLSQALLERDPIEGTERLKRSDSSVLLGLDKRHGSEMTLVANM